MWKNSNPNTEFIPQTITLNNDEYNYYEIIYREDTINIISFNTGKIPIGESTCMFRSTYIDKAYIRERMVHNNGSTITFEQGIQNYNSANTILIPLKVLGYNC